MRVDKVAICWPAQNRWVVLFQLQFFYHFFSFFFFLNISLYKYNYSPVESVLRLEKTNVYRETFPTSPAPNKRSTLCEINSRFGQCEKIKIIVLLYSANYCGPRRN